MGDYVAWINAYASDEQPVDASTVLDIFDSLAVGFDFVTKPYYSYGTDEEGRVSDCRPWLAEKLRQQRDSMRPDRYCDQVSLHGVSRKQMTWCFEANSCSKYQHHDQGQWARDPSILVMADFDLARQPKSVEVFLERVARRLIHDPRIWYGLIDVVLREHTRHDGFYHGEIYTGITWERQIEQSYWREDAMGSRDRVRGLYWGNIFGAAFTQRLHDAGYEEGVRGLHERWEVVPGGRGSVPAVPVTLRDENGSMAVLLDDEPVRFAKRRDMRLTSMDRAVLTGTMLRSVMSRAGLL
ncbi:MAG: hypothetical protein KAS72_14480 [Phycisphaerales bacterium]|nr:hypothetical protein [Phycisphaerales bacterium]